MMARIILVCALIAACYGVKLPASFQKCQRNQPDLKECILKAAQNGILQLEKPLENFRLPNINPFEVSNLVIEGKGTVAVEQKYKDCKVYGLHDIQFDQFEFDFEKKTLNLTGVFKEFKKQCQYEFDGKILLLPIRGTGPSTVVLRGLHVRVFLSYEEVKNKGKTFIKFVSSKVDADPELVTYNFENLFDGDKRLGDNINKVMNENWKEVFEDVKDGYLAVVGEIVRNVFNSFFSKVSLEEALD